MADSGEILVKDLAGGLDLDRRRNYAQLIAGLVGSAVGAAMGFTSVVEDAGLAALAGAVVGFVGGTFIAGLALMFRSAARITVREATAKHQRLRRHLWYCFAAWLLVFASLPLVLRFAHDVVVIGWLCAATGLCAYVRTRKADLDQFEKEIANGKKEPEDDLPS